MNHPRVVHILENLETFHHGYYKHAVFAGPSLYFHQRSLERRASLDSFAEASYAMLSAWGMHRMGSGGSKMKNFGFYKDSLRSVWGMIQEASDFELTKMCDAKWNLLKLVFFQLDVMASKTTLVGHSKVMAHALPELIPPIDREYTLVYLRGKKYIQNNKEKEWATLRELITSFFLPVVNDESFKNKHAAWKLEDYPWNTSALKVVDNLLIGAVRSQRAKM